MPTLDSTPESMMVPAVGASTYASGNQVWNGKIGTLIAKPANKSKNTRTCGLVQDSVRYHSGQSSELRRLVRSGIEKVSRCSRSNW